MGKISLLERFFAVGAVARWWADQQTLRKLQAIKNSVDARIEYRDTGENIWLYIPRGAVAYGDCQVFTETYMVDCQLAGYPALGHVYLLPDKRAHAVCIVDGRFILDCRHKLVQKV